MAHGSTAALNHFIAEFPSLKYTTICEWRKAIIDTSGQDPEHKPITELPVQKSGRSSTLPDEILSILKKYIYVIIVIAAGLGIVKKVNPGILECNGGYVVIKKSWAK